METANIILALGGDNGNTVPKRGVTPAEIALLRAIHGDDAVTDIEPTGDEATNEDGRKRSNRDELSRLRSLYPAKDGASGTRIVDILYPGAAARVFETIDELEIDEVFFKPAERVKPTPKAEIKPAPTGDLDEMTKAELVAEAKRRGVEIDTSDKKDVILAALKAAGSAATLNDPAVGEDGIGDDMSDEKLFG